MARPKSYHNEVFAEVREQVQVAREKLGITSPRSTSATDENGTVKKIAYGVTLDSGTSPSSDWDQVEVPDDGQIEFTNPHEAIAYCVTAEGPAKLNVLILSTSADGEKGKSTKVGSVVKVK